ncbi:MAG: hypothetical protein AAF604_23090 [Acidobacteriota bacterium]
MRKLLLLAILWALPGTIGPATFDPAAAAADRPTSAQLRAALEESLGRAAEAGWRGEVLSEGDLWRWEVTTGADGAYRFALEQPDGERVVLWRDDAGAYRWSSVDDRQDSVSSLSAALQRLDAAAGPDLFLLPAWLADGSEALQPPEAATVDGPEDCAVGECWILTWGRLAGDLETRLWIGVADQQLEKIEVARFGTGSAPRRWLVSWRSGEGTIEGPAFVPPTAAFGETVEVALRSLAVRVVDSRGVALENLAPEHFEVTTGRRRERQNLPVVAVDWIASSPPGRAADATPPSAPRRRDLGGADGESGEGQSIIFFVQPDMHAVRTVGHLRILPQVRAMLDLLPAADRAAVVSFDSHLKLWQDLTHDRSAVFDAVERSVRFSAKPSGRRTTGPGLADHWDRQAALDAARPETALRLVAEALEALPGEKAMVYLGWSLGRFDGRGVSMGQDYGPAVQALERARTTVFVLDITDADFHTLEVGLQRVAADTGGTYERTHIFTGQVVRRLARTLAGFYRLSIQTDELPADVEVRLVGVEGRVLVRPGAG